MYADVRYFHHQSTSTDENNEIVSRPTDKINEVLFRSTVENNEAVYGLGLKIPNIRSLLILHALYCLGHSQSSSNHLSAKVFVTDCLFSDHVFLIYRQSNIFYYILSTVFFLQVVKNENRINAM